MPQWVEQGYNDYAGRLNRNVKLVLKALPAEKEQKRVILVRYVKKHPKNYCKRLQSVILSLH